LLAALFGGDLARRLVRESVAVKNWATPIRRIPEPRLRRSGLRWLSSRGPRRSSPFSSIFRS